MASSKRKAKPTKAKPTKAKQTKAKPTKAKPTKAKPASKAKLTKAKPTKAKPTSKAKLTKAKPIEAAVAIGLTFKIKSTRAPAASKLGGLPALPAKFTWPTNELSDEPLGYVLQINFAELQASCPTAELPAQGVMQLFCSIEETDLSSPEPSFAVVYHPDPSALVTTALPEELDVDEATLEQRVIHFGGGGTARMLGEPPHLPTELGSFDPTTEVLLLDLEAYGNVTRVEESHSIFGEGRFVLIITRAELAKHQLDKAQLVFVSGT